MAKKDIFDLGGLDTYEHLFVGLREEFSQMLKEEAAKEAAYIHKYGREEGLRQYMDDLVSGCTPDYDIDLRSVNVAIYCGCMPLMSSRKMYVSLEKRYEARMHELYGDRYNELKHHSRGDSRVVEILLQDALKTGRWKELPDELHEEYKRRAGLS